MKALILGFLLRLAMCAQTAPVTAFFGAPQTAGITVNLSATGYTIPANFVGWSVENQDVIAGYYSETQTTFVSLAKLLGANGILRIGGITSDTTSLPALTQGIANHLQAYTAALGSGWTLIYGLDACDQSAANGLTQANMLITAYGVSKVVFQVGNEPPFETCGLTQGQWTTQFNAYYTAIIGANASAKFAAPDVTNNSTVQSFVNGTTPGVSGLTYVSAHWYPYGIGYTPAADQLIAQVYNNDTVSTVNSFAFQSNSAFAPGKLIMSETNSRAGCGLQGVSDRLMASTWYLNLAIALANDGWAGIMPHNAILPCFGQPHNGYYNWVNLQTDGTFAPAPLFYGMYLFSQIEGQVTATFGKSGSAYIRAIATVDPVTTHANILVQNNATTFPVTVTPNQNVAWTTASVLILSGTACNDAAPTLGGASFGTGGSWAGTARTITNGQSVTLPPCGAALIRIN